MFFVISIAFTLLAFNTDEVFSCTGVVAENGCCITGFTLCPGHYPPTCDIFGANCVQCKQTYEAYKCNYTVACSCFYCCEQKYAELCPSGCDGCVKDGDGGCPQNSAARFKTLDNNASLTTTGLLDSVAITRGRFDTIDTDKSGSISLKEAIVHLSSAKATNNGTTAESLAKNVSWFVAIDTNGNNQIEPVEFDRSLGVRNG